MNKQKRTSTIMKPVALAMGLALAVSGPALAGHHEIKTHKNANKETVQKWQGEAYQAWLDGKVETALLLNTNLNSFEINTKTDANHVTLSGTVNSEVEAELAEEITKGVKGVEGVTNKLVVDTEMKAKQEESEGKSFSQHWEDATTTATIKSKLLLEDTVKGLDINVDTHYSEVTLNGEVNSDAERDLVEAIAENTKSVTKVNNNLRIVEEQS